ncbi:M64 family metallopeptidase [Sphingobacterium psychroaquaticum]|uniref:IgA Peptidase M64 n=1 Tax=Sphingobacterium psychroaquaticum TaxID=561061 RepID=A0A1X7JTX8_9SPHI|nr:M64 family metallopeptidase [Sphingobacterium psychroaquaticum]SMG31278.1 IgA Peptidase M64 [Sphingobacterium psychroaquaticum]
MFKIIYRAISTVVVLIGATCAVYAQKYPIDTLQYQGTDKKVVNLVILADGYTQQEMGAFHEDAKRFTDYFFKTEPFRQYTNFFNVFAINTPSKESGAAHAGTADDCPKVEHGHKDLPARFNDFPKRIAVPEAQPNTIFGSSFDNYGLHRLVIPQKNDVIEKVLADNIPNHTQVVILVNSPFYGGSGGKYATATVNASSNDIAVHEIGHSFAILADEYWAGNQYAIEGPNRTQSADPKHVPWRHWLGINGVGIYAYGGNNSPAKWFRPHEFCKMQYLVAPFCSVCQEVFVETIHQKADPIAGTKPALDTQVDAASVGLFALKLLKPSPNTLRVKWFLNDIQIASDLDSIYLNPGQFDVGNNVLRAEVRDTTTLVRTPSKQIYSYEVKWNINANMEYAMRLPASTWGDTLETCYAGYQALSMKQPEAGVQYNWYDSVEGKTPFAVGTNLVSPKLTKSTVYFVESVWKGKKSDRVPISVEVLPQIQAPKNYKVEKQKDGKTVTITLLEKADTRYSFLWKKMDGTVLYEWDEFSDEYVRSGKFNNVMRLKIGDGEKHISVQKVDNEMTCVSAPLIIEIK